MERKQTLSKQIKRHSKLPVKKEQEYDGNFESIISTGSTLVDLAISGKRIRGGGIPGGILLEVFGPSQSGKSVFLSELAGEVERKGGEDQFHDPEARLDQEFSAIFGMHIKAENYHQPNTVTELFGNVRKWEPKAKKGIIHGIFADSLAALSTDMEMEEEDGDKMGGRRAKEFSEQLRKTCRIIKQKNYIMACSNQLRMKMNTTKYEEKYTTPGGEAVKFYASIRLKFSTPEKLDDTIKVAGKEIKKIIGIKTMVEAVKTVDEPYRKAPLYIIYGYGIDDIRANLQYIKDYTSNTVYQVGDIVLDKSMEESIAMVEEQDLVLELKNEVIDLWEAIEAKFKTERKPKMR